MKSFELSSQKIELLKYIALILMIGDHYASIHLETYSIFKILGRIVFPLFSIILVYNYIYNTSNKFNFIKRLFIFGLISEPIHYFLFYDYFGQWFLNIFFSLSFGLIFIYIYEQTLLKKTYEKFFIYISLFIIGLPLSLFLSYEIFAIPLILLSYVFIKKTNIYTLLILLSWIYLMNYSYSEIYSIVGFFSLILCYIIPNLKIKKINKWFFYISYPIHLLIIKII